MTKKEFDAKIDDLIDASFIGYVKDECTRLFKSGAVDTEKYEDNYRLPKTILTVALENTAHQYRPIIDRDKRVASNLRKL
jgi:hypothetical protein